MTLCTFLRTHLELNKNLTKSTLKCRMQKMLATGRYTKEIYQYKKLGIKEEVKAFAQRGCIFRSLWYLNSSECIA